jgi:hypothetical protein
MPIVAECPNCGKKLKIPDDLIGKTVRCSDCAGTFLAAKPRSVAPLPPPPEERFADEFDERPSRREPLPTYERPRGGMLLTFGILSISLAVVGILIDTTAVGFSACLVCCPVLPVWGIAIFATIFCAIGLAMGIMAWMMGSTDLRKMAAGTMDPAARGSAKGGMICGIVGTALNALALIFSCILIVGSLAFGAAMLASIRTNPTINRPPIGPQRPGRFSADAPMKLPNHLPACSLES